MISHPGSIDDSNLLLWVAHNLERAADRVTNICERTVFIATGELLELDSRTTKSRTETVEISGGRSWELRGFIRHTPTDTGLLGCEACLSVGLITAGGGDMRHVRLLLMGFGNVGRALVSLLARKQALLERDYGITFQVNGVMTGRHGAAFDPLGLDLKTLIRLGQSGGDLSELSAQPVPASRLAFIRQCKADIFLKTHRSVTTTGSRRSAICGPRWKTACMPSPPTKARL